MQQLNLGGDELVLVASPLTPWIYKREFGEDMLTELAVMAKATRGERDIEPEPKAGGLAAGGEADTKTPDVDETVDFDLSKINVFAFIQMIWAMAKTATPGKMPSFDRWLASLPEDALDLTALDFGPVMTELQRGFFRGTKGAAAPTPQPAEQQ